MNPPIVQRPAPTGRIGRRKVVTLPVDRVHPFIRIAHRKRGPLNIQERIILDHEFVLILKGRGTFVTREKSVAFDAGTLLFIRPFEPHGFRSDSVVCEHIAVHFDFTRDFVETANDPAERRPYEVRLAGGLVIPDVQRPGGVTDLFLRIVHARAASKALSLIEEQACLLHILTQVVSPKSDQAGDEALPSQRDRVRIERALEFVKTHLTTPLDLEQLAEVSGLSESQFTRLFRRHTGYSPMLFLRRARVQRARELLENPDLAIKEVARQCGFDDAYHFSRVFHQTDGLPPSRYRESVLAGRLNRPEAHRRV